MMVMFSHLLISVKSSLWSQNRLDNKRLDGTTQAINTIRAHPITSMEGNGTTEVWHIYPWYVHPKKDKTNKKNEKKKGTKKGRKGKEKKRKEREDK